MSRELLILYIEDSVDNHLLFSLYLKKEPYDIIFATTVKEALDKLNSNSVDILLLDWHLPGGISGKNALNTIREAFGEEDVPVLVVTGSSADEMRKELEGVQINGILHKPIKKEDLVSALEDITVNG